MPKAKKITAVEIAGMSAEELASEETRLRIQQTIRGKSKAKSTGPKKPKTSDRNLSPHDRMRIGYEKDPAAAADKVPERSADHLKNRMSYKTGGPDGN